MQDKLEQAYRENVEAQFSELRARIELLEAQADKVKADAKVEYNKRLAELREQRKDVEARLQTLGNTGRDAWQDLQEGIDQALTDLREAVKNAFSRFEVQVD
jgi:hypothetical protein